MRYKYLNEFDSAMNNLDAKYHWLEALPVSRSIFIRRIHILTFRTGVRLVKARSEDPFILTNPPHKFTYLLLRNQVDKVIVYERAGLLFVFNFHPSQSFADYRVGVEQAGKYEIVLSSDEKKYGGFDRVATPGEFFTTPLEWNGRKNFLQVRHCSLDLSFFYSLMVVA